MVTVGGTTQSLGWQETTRLDENSRTVGTFGSADDGAGLSYAPPCAQGGGTKSYTFTLYALSGMPNLSGLSQSQVTGSVLVNALAPVTISSSAITLTHTR
jgi:hypothetical protein